MLALQAGSRMRWEDVDRYVRRTIDVIVQLERVGGQRRIGQVLDLRAAPDRQQQDVVE